MNLLSKNVFMTEMSNKYVSPAKILMTQLRIDNSIWIN